MSVVALRIDGMHCGSCIRRVTQALNSAGDPGSITVEEVRLGAARFSASDGAAEVDAAIAALAKAGYSAHLDEA
jgi:copper chaperone